MSLCVCMCVLLSFYISNLHYWLGPSFNGYLIYSICMNTVKSKNRIHSSRSSSSSRSRDWIDYCSLCNMSQEDLFFEYQQGRIQAVFLDR